MKMSAIRSVRISLKAFFIILALGYCQFHCKWFLQISMREKSKSIPPVLSPLFIDEISWGSEFDTNKDFSIILTNQRIRFDDVVPLSSTRAEPPMNRPYRRGYTF